MNAVADKFDHGDGMIDWREFMAALRYIYHMMFGRYRLDRRRFGQHYFGQQCFDQHRFGQLRFD